MIVLTLGGGLGNQMFEYAFARQLQIETSDKEIKFNTFHVVLYENNKEALHNLCLNESVSVCNQFEKNLYKYLEKIKRRLCVWIKRYQWDDQNLFYKLSQHGIFYNTTIFDKLEYCVPKNKMKYIYGVYQNPHFWLQNREIIKAELKVKTEPSLENKNMLKKIEEANSVCVHVRRGDYVTNPRWKDLNICSENYYNAAMEYMEQHVPNCKFFIFSNNHEELVWIKNNYNFSKYNVEYVDLSNPDYEELRLMYHCKHFVIANSTFSWWAQFLSENREKVVCAPKYWMEGLECSDILYEDGWKIFDC